MKNFNFAFVRHGYGCHNAAKPLYKNGILSIKEVDVLRIRDPELTPLGVDASKNNGCVVSKILKKIHVLANDPNMEMSAIHIVGCSPLIRSMETAYFMTRNWKNPPTKIYVFPLLREIDESSSDKYSPKSRQAIDTIPSYAMKSLQEQKQYLSSIGILQYFDFSFVDNNDTLRKEPGDIREFVKWFSTRSSLKNAKSINCFIVTHAGVLRDYADEGFANNSGFVLNTTMTNDNDISYNKMLILDTFLPTYFFSNYNSTEYTNTEYFCPSSRCGQLCNVIPANTSKKDRKQLDNIGCAAYNEDDYT
jgi:hypothetical protein